MCRLRFLTILVIICICICGFACPLHAQEDFPVGTVAAIVLDHTIDSRDSRPGQLIVARIAQEVSLENKRVIRVQSKVGRSSWQAR